MWWDAAQNGMTLNSAKASPLGAIRLREFIPFVILADLAVLVLLLTKYE